MPTASHSASIFRSARARNMALSVENAFSIGLKSEPYGGKNMSLAQAYSMASRTPADWWPGKLSIVTRRLPEGSEAILARPRPGTHFRSLRHRRRTGPSSLSGAQCTGGGRCFPMALRHASPATLAQTGYWSRTGLCNAVSLAVESGHRYRRGSSVLCLQSTGVLALVT